MEPSVLDIPLGIEQSLEKQGFVEVLSANTGREVLLFTSATLDCFISALSDEGFKEAALRSVQELRNGLGKSIDVEKDELFNF
ncbi:MAG: hypothetical protein QM703_26770 [Gemmatales bacterium]